MIRKSDQDKLKLLLTQAIPLMCKNILHFKSEFSVEALIGITLDKDRTVLVNINETLHASQDPGATVSTTNVSGIYQAVYPVPNQPEGNYVSPGLSRKRKKILHPRKRSRSEIGGSEDIRSQQEELACDASSEGHSTKLCQLSNVVSMCPPITVKQEADEDSDVYKVDGEVDVNLYDDNVDCEMGICKVEPEGPGPGNLEQLLSDEREICEDEQWATNSMDLVDKSEESPFNATCSTSMTNTQTSADMKDGDAAVNAPCTVVTAGLHYSMHRMGTTSRLSCHTCGKSYGETRNMVDHIHATHLGVMRHHCKDCGKTFGWRSDVVKHKRKGRCPCNETA